MQNRFDVKFWNERYETSRTGWDIGCVSTPLKEYIDQITDKDIKILIPGCGNSYEAEYLSKKGFRNITLIDISDSLIKNLEKKFGNNKNVSLFTEDFFEHKGNYDLILEQTFFCAIDPSLRENYALKMKNLINKNGKLAGVLFINNNNEPLKNQNNEEPPFFGSVSEYKNIFSKYFHINVMEECYNSISPRSGREIFINLKVK